MYNYAVLCIMALFGYFLMVFKLKNSKFRPFMHNFCIFTHSNLFGYKIIKIIFALKLDYQIQFFA